jgi:hypothetical protein
MPTTSCARSRRRIQTALLPPPSYSPKNVFYWALLTSSFTTVFHKFYGLMTELCLRILKAANFRRSLEMRCNLHTFHKIFYTIFHYLFFFLLRLSAFNDGSQCLPDNSWINSPFLVHPLKLLLLFSNLAMVNTHIISKINLIHRFFNRARASSIFKRFICLPFITRTCGLNFNERKALKFLLLFTPLAVVNTHIISKVNRIRIDCFCKRALHVFSKGFSVLTFQHPYLWFEFQ